MDNIFVKFFGVGLGIDCFWSRSRTLGLEIFQSRSRSWSWKNYRVSFSILFSTVLVSTTSLHGPRSKFTLAILLCLSKRHFSSSCLAILASNSKFQSYTVTCICKCKNQNEKTSTGQQYLGISGSRSR